MKKKEIIRSARSSGKNKITQKYIEKELHKIFKEKEENTDRKIVIYTRSREMVELFHQMLKEEANKFLDELPEDN